jgi:hypothetical protein
METTMDDTAPQTATVPTTDVFVAGLHLDAPSPAVAHTERPARAKVSLTNRRGQGAGIIATLSDELHGQLAHDLVAEIVQGVLDEARQGLQDRALDSSILQARERLERLIRARARTAGTPEVWMQSS